jgi:hypothetical protein
VSATVSIVLLRQHLRLLREQSGRDSNVIRLRSPEPEQGALLLLQLLRITNPVVDERGRREQPRKGARAAEVIRHPLDAQSNAVVELGRGTRASMASPRHEPKLEEAKLEEASLQARVRVLLVLEAEQEG